MFKKDFVKKQNKKYFFNRILHDFYNKILLQKKIFYFRKCSFLYKIL